jgi:hypothetical protein
MKLLKLRELAPRRILGDYGHTALPHDYRNLQGNAVMSSTGAHFNFNRQGAEMLPCLLLQREKKGRSYCHSQRRSAVFASSCWLVPATRGTIG